MFYPKLKFLIFLLIASLFLQSCAKDNELLETEDPLTLARTGQNETGNNGPTGQAGPDGQGGPNGQGGNGQGGPDGQGGPIGEAPNQIDNDVVVDWMDLFLALERYAGGMRPNASARAIAYINLAAYETAVPGMPDYVSNSQFFQGLNIPSPNNPNINWEVALNACYADVLRHFLLNLPNNLRRQIGQLEESLEEEFSAGVPNNRLNNSRNWGQAVARQVIAFSQTDEAAEAQILNPQPTSYAPPISDGYWTFSAEPERALFPYWKEVRTFIITPEQTTTVAPLPYSSNPASAYYQQMQEAYTANNEARAADGEDLWIAEFWSDDVEGITFSPPARQVSIANQLIVDRSMNLETSLHLLLKLGFSLNDAAVATWKYKYEYMVMRPSVFIHEFIDPAFQTNLYRLIPWPNPSFPGYPSGHSCFASAAAGVFINFFGNTINFTDRSHEGRTEFRGAPRTFQTFEDLAAENGYSRLPLGVHIRMDCTEGLRLGYEIADAINEHSVQQDPG